MTLDTHTLLAHNSFTVFSQVHPLGHHLHTRAARHRWRTRRTAHGRTGAHAATGTAPLQYVRSQIPSSITLYLRAASPQEDEHYGKQQEADCAPGVAHTRLVSLEVSLVSKHARKWWF